MMPIALLMIEHRQIERMVPLLRTEANNARAGRIDPLRIDTLVDFVRTYADRCHHGKEEDILFVELGAKPMPTELKAIMEGLIEDHKVSRANTKLVVAANSRYRPGDEQGLSEMANALDTLASLYPEHIRKEDRDFFIPCMALFSREEQGRMLAKFQAFDRNLVHQVYKDKLNAMTGPEARKEAGKVSKGKGAPGERWVCTVCDFIYDPAKGDPEHGIPPGTAFKDLPEDWACPVCGAEKGAFQMS